MYFSDLIRKNSTEVEVIKESDGYFDGPKWVDGTKTTYTAKLAVFFMTPKSIEYYSGGDYTTQDLKLQTTEGLTAINQSTGKEEAITLEIEDQIVFQGATYEVREHQPRTIHADYHEYVAKKKVK
jgi:hypothetical protein